MLQALCRQHLHALRAHIVLAQAAVSNDEKKSEKKSNGGIRQTVPATKGSKLRVKNANNNLLQFQQLGTVAQLGTQRAHTFHSDVVVIQPGSQGKLVSKAGSKEK